MNMYFIALVAPDEINQKILKWKEWMKERFSCEVALRSPAHITLIPPFWMQPDLEKVLIDSIKEFSAGVKSFSILLKDFSCFQPKVIFTNVVKNDELLHLKQDLEQFLISANKFPINKDDRVFHPHVTLATRDLYKKAFYEAWEYFKEKKYEAQWQAEGLSLLRHNQKKWDVITTSQFKTL